MLLADKDINQNFDSAYLEGTGVSNGESIMALSIPPASVVSAESQNRNVTQASQGFSQSLEKLSSSLRQSGAGARPAEYGAQVEERVKAAELGKSVRNANDAVSEARIAGEGLGRLDSLLGKARSLAFGSINEPGRRERETDQVEYSRVLKEIDSIASSVVFGGGALIEGSASFGPEGSLKSIDLSSFKGSIGAIQVIDRAIGEVSDQRGLLGVFQTHKLASIGNLLRGGLGGLVSSDSVVRDRTVAERLATSAVSELQSQPDSSLLGSGNAAGQILASIVGRL